MFSAFTTKKMNLIFTFNSPVEHAKREENWPYVAVLDIRFNNKVNPKTKGHANIRMGGVDISHFIFVLRDIGWFENERRQPLFRLIIS